MAENIRRVDIAESVGTSFLNYAMAVIASRALIDVRDGLKPVNRRILYAMSELGMASDKPYKKSARTIGEVIGKFHPHGDTAAYEAMVNLAQDFGMRYPLVDGHGNFGSIDGDPAAAMRYTEARLTRFGEAMLRDINKNTVDFKPNFDQEEEEPVILPTLFPNMLANGTSGIAVGMASSIPPHNVAELYDAMDYIAAQALNGEEADEDHILNIVRAPDFPTGGQIIGLGDVKKGYRTGRGRVVIRAKCEIEETKSGSQIVVTEIPYKVNKASLVVQIDTIRKDDPAFGIKEVRDESSREGMRMVIELKKDANPQVVLKKLLKKTNLESAFSINFTVLVDGQPVEVGIKTILENFMAHAINVILRRTQYDLDKAQARAHIVDALIVAMNNVDQVIEIIRSSKTDPEAYEKLSEAFGFDDAQAKVVAETRLIRLNEAGVQKLMSEREDLGNNIAKYTAILEDQSVLISTMRSEFAAYRTEFGDDRRTEIVVDEDSITEDDLIEDEMLVVTLSSDGIIKSVEEREYRTQNRGTKGAKATNVKEDEVIRYLLTVGSKDDLLFFTNLGRCHVLKAYKIAKSNRQARGKSINNYLKLDGGEHIVSMLCTKLSSKEDDLLFVTRGGMIKRLALEELSVRLNVTRVIGFKEGDSLVTATIVSPEDEVMITTAGGMSIRIAMNATGSKQIRQMGRAAAGVVGVDLADNDYVVDMAKVEANGTILTVTENGLGKRTCVSEYPVQGRGGKGVITHKVNAKTGKLVAAMTVHDNDELFVATEQGLVIRIAVSSISTMGRSTSGVKVMNTNEGDRIVSISKGQKDSDESAEPDPSA